jgi:hypothetical protein
VTEAFRASLLDWLKLTRIALQNVSRANIKTHAVLIQCLLAKETAPAHALAGAVFCNVQLSWPSVCVPDHLAGGGSAALE